jgi:DNA-binding transcriptional LysR family regulator
MELEQDESLQDRRRLHLTTEQLRCFVAVASSLHFGQAASELYLSQPALSRQIVRLETVLNARLLDRSTRRVALTPKGAEFLPYARDLIVSFDNAVENLRSLDTSGEELWLSHPPSTSAAVGAMLRALNDNYPQFTVYCTERVEGATRPDPGAAQLGLEHQASTEAPFALVDLGAEPMHLLVVPDHPLAELALVTAYDLYGQSIVVSAQCYSSPQRLALAELLRDIADVDFQEMPTDAAGLTQTMSASGPVMVPAADDSYLDSRLVAIPVEATLCPQLSVWWQPRYSALMRAVLEDARQRLVQLSPDSRSATSG